MLRSETRSCGVRSDGCGCSALQAPVGEAKADGGEESACGWLKDEFGLSWQVVPTVLIDMLHDKDSRKSEHVMRAMLQMQKIDIKKLKAVYAGK